MKDKKANADTKDVKEKESMIQIPELSPKNKPNTYSSKGEPIKVPNGATHYTATVNTDNSIKQAKSKPQKGEEKDPIDIARDLYNKIKDAAEIGNAIEAHNDGFDLVKKGEHIIIKGAGSNTAEKMGIEGTRYKIDNLEKYPSVAKLVDPKLAAKDALSVKGETLIEPGLGLIANITNKAPGTKVVADAAVDVTKGIISGEAAALTTAMAADIMLNKSNPLSGATKAPVITTATLTGMMVGKAVDAALESSANKLKDSLKKGIDKLVNTDYSKPDKSRPIERHDPIQKHERAEKPHKEDKPVINTKPVREEPVKNEKNDNRQPKNDRPIERHTPPQKHERADKPVLNDKPVKEDKPVGRDPFKDDKPDNNQPKNDKSVSRDPFRDEKPDNRQSKAERPSSPKSKPAPNERPKGRLIDY